MGFSVDAAALAGLPRQLDRLEEDATTARTYLQRYTQLNAGEGIINLILGGHREATRKVSEFYWLVNAVADGQSRAVSSSVAHYRQTDVAAAAAFDAKLPTVASPPQLDPALSSAGFVDRGEPQSDLTTPKDYSTEYRFEMKWHSYLSPTSYVRNVIWKATVLAARFGIMDKPIDIFLEWLKPFLGDWDAFRACADVHENLADATVTMGTNMRSGANDSQYVWTGNAANACRRDLGGIADALNLANRKLTELSAEYRSVAESTRKLAEAVAALVVVAADLAAMALLSLTAAARGGPGPTLAVNVAVGARSIWQVIEIGMKILDSIKIAESGAKAFTSGMDGFNVIDPKGPMPALAGGATPAYTPPVHGGGGRVPAFT
ncbi:hypothetical protein GCM10009557_30820 [Virgisporangium ochraceum]|uniref:Outer membrane channel protein CpnT-like N-terminal domain-containing protein n=1 Tax=Virgisporangium ochraceum TaxID=65505 RepID=A0A8J4A2H9_9ACTN|nr:hypothetical protein [Virgisporangium ochraceum]GIJ74654.1 hypothetical protein Voc01_095710 [Virgisporangium ochraceum]